MIAAAALQIGAVALLADLQNQIFVQNAESRVELQEGFASIDDEEGGRKKNLFIEATTRERSIGYARARAKGDGGGGGGKRANAAATCSSRVARARAQ